VRARTPVPPRFQPAATSSRFALITAFPPRPRFFARFNFNNISGSSHQPDQTAIDPSFAIRFYDHQRNVGVTYSRTVSPQMTSESSLGFIRSTPMYPTLNHSQPGLSFADGVFESFNTAAGSVMGAFTGLFQARQNFTYVHASTRSNGAARRASTATPRSLE